MKTFLKSIKLIVLLIVIFSSSCTNEFDYGKLINAVKTVEYSNVTQTTSNVSGNIITDNGSNIIERGICYGTNSNPTVSGPKKVFNTAALGNYICTLDNLSPSTTYYARAYATNDYGTAYGTSVTFTTLQATVPIISSTTAASLITATTASTGGTISNSGASNITSRGVCWSSSITTPTIFNSTTNNGSGIGTFTSSLTGLTANTTYYVRAYATNSVGTAYGNTITFTTSPNLAVGQSYQGGIIAYIFVPGDSGYVAGQTHGLIATTTNQSTGAQWGCSGTSITGTSTTLGTGLANTTAIVNLCTTITIAAALCNNLVSGGYSDWYLPSRDELNKLYLNKAAVGGFSNVAYWSSSQVGTTTSWSINFITGILSSTSTKSTLLYVRAIRRF